MTDPVSAVVAAINAHDLDAFVACYAPGATIEDGYDHVGVNGHDGMRAMYTTLFEKYPEVHIEPGWRTEAGEFVVQEETVTGREDHTRHVAIYLVRDGVIVRERLVA